MTDLPSSAAVVIVGGGVMGTSIAYHLAVRGQRDVVLLERSELFGQGATGKCAGGVRHQFASEINIRLSTASIRMLEAFETEPGHAIGLRQCGYLFILTQPEDVAAFRQNVALQHRLGVMTEWLTADEVRARVPQIVGDDVLGGTFYGRDGIADPSGVIDGYVSAARRLGVTLLTGVEVTGLGVGSNSVRSVQTSVGSIEAGMVVNAAGPFAADIGWMHGADLPITPLRRQMLLTTPLPEIPPDFPFVIDFATGLYFHREGTGLLTGMANRAEPPGIDESVDLEWERIALEFAVRRMPLLEHAGLARHWAGLYEMTPDAHPMVGRLEPFENVFVAAGFSGHGFMQGPIIGKLMAEVMLDGEAHSIDIGALDPARFASGKTLREYNVV
ncbi:MAG TPA: FAD-binding oxidoreductase [Chloroflexota bacterium]|nr:FAD-binding oxidoreductase [Chloroflexota bacterium]